MTLSTELARLAEAATPGPWELCFYDAGDREHYDHNGPCPSIQAPESEDCAVVHWDGFKQRYWSSANGNQRQIEANAAMIVALRNNLPTIIAALKAAETPLGDVAGLVNEARLDAKAFREHNVYDSEGDPVRLAQNAARLDQYADAITALTRQLGEAQQHAEALATACEGLRDDLLERAEWDGKTKVVVAGNGAWFRFNVALAAYRSVK